jgi:hypothetical protein
VGHRQPHRRHPFPRVDAACAPRGEPGDRRRREPLCRAGCNAGLWLLGIEQRIDPTAECKGNAYQSAFELPRGLNQAVSLLRAETDLAEVLGKEFLTVYTEIKDLEHEEFMRVISPWEREHLLLHV